MDAQFYRLQALRVRDLAGKADPFPSGGVGVDVPGIEAHRGAGAPVRRWPSPSSRRLPPYPRDSRARQYRQFGAAAIGSFARFVPKEIVRRVIDNSISTKLGGVKQEITLVFTDVEGFTTIAEAADPTC